VPRSAALLACVALLAFSPDAPAGFEEGAEAAARADYATALAEWRPLAEQGRPDAQFELGWLYARGKGVPLDYDEAVRWFKKSAEQGFAPAQYRLGLHYYGGVGIAKDQDEAYFWIGVAAVSGHEEARRWPDEIHADLTQQEMLALQRRIRAWRPPLAPVLEEVESPRPSPEPASAEAVDSRSETSPAQIARSRRTAAAEPVLVQLAALRSPEGARTEWQRLRRGHAELFGELEPTITRIDLGPPRGTFYRLRIALASEDEAREFCDLAAQRAVRCFVVDTPSE